jgi:MFS family permease
MLYAKRGKSIGRVIFIGAVCSSVCYLVAALSPIPFIGLIAVAFTGIATAMFWPGNLMAAAEKYPGGGVVIYALMAAGGDLGASVGPQMIGIITDTVSKIPAVIDVASRMGLTPDGVAMRVGMLLGALFSVMAIPTYYIIRKGRRREEREE